jgi:hypothetical protein
MPALSPLEKRILNSEQLELCVQQNVRLEQISTMCYLGWLLILPVFSPS